MTDKLKIAKSVLDLLVYLLLCWFVVDSNQRLQDVETALRMQIQSNTKVDEAFVTFAERTAEWIEASADD